MFLGHETVKEIAERIVSMQVPDYDEGSKGGFSVSDAGLGAPPTSLTPVQQHAAPAIAGATVLALIVGYAVGAAGGGGDAAAAPAAACAAPRSSWGHVPISDAARDQATLDSFSPRVRALLDSLTLPQKIGQMTQFNLDEAFADNGNFKSTPQFADEPWALLDEELIRRYTKAPYFVGSWLNSPFSDDAIRDGTAGNQRSSLNASEWRLIIDRLQTITTEDGLPPMVFGIDSVHGAIYVGGATVFPHQINQAASFNVAAAQQAGRITAKDSKAAGMPWLFAPILGLATQPAWSRVFEMFGEDPHLASQMGAAVVTGMQGGASGKAGGDLTDPQAAAACAKHYIGYGNSENGHDRSPTVIPDRHLLEYFAPSFQAAFDAGCRTVMNAYTEINGQPMASSAKYLKELIRDEMGWNGMLVTDWSEIRNQHDWHKVAETHVDAIELAMTETTIDMSMVPNTIRDWQEDGLGPITSAATSFPTDMAALTASGKVTEQRVNVAAGRVLQLKEDLGLLDDPMLDSSRSLIPTVGQAEDRAVAGDIARESLTLLRNRFVEWEQGSRFPTLPLPPGLKVLITGAAADSRRLLCGGWTNHWQGPVDDSPTEFPHQQETVGQAFARMYSAGETVIEPGYTLAHGQDAADISGVSQAIIDADAHDVEAIVLVFGEEVYAEKPGDIEDLELPMQFRNYAEAIIKQEARVARGEAPIPVVAVLVEGRTRLLRGCLDGAAAIVWAGLPRPEGGVAIAELLIGAFSPSGRLPISYPKKDTGLGYGGQYWHKVTHQCNGPDTQTSAFSVVDDRFPHFSPIGAHPLLLTYTIANGCEADASFVRRRAGGEPRGFGSRGRERRLFP